MSSFFSSRPTSTSQVRPITRQNARVSAALPVFSTTATSACIFSRLVLSALRVLYVCWVLLEHALVLVPISVLSVLNFWCIHNASCVP